MTSRYTAWITGGGTGIGKALAEVLFRQGHRVVISGRRKEVLAAARQEIERAPGGGEILDLAGDASRPEDVDKIITAVDKLWGRITLLVNNAGVLYYGK